MDQLEKQLADLFGKLPHLPSSLRELIVKVSPWAALILGILILPFILAAFGLGLLVAPLSVLGGAGLSARYVIALVISALGMFFWYAAIPGLMRRSKGGWNKSLYAVLIGAIGNLFTFDIWRLVIGTLISLYFLFEIRPYYNGTAKPSAPAAPR